MRSTTGASGRQMAAILAAIATVVLVAAIMTYFRGSAPPPSLQSLERARTQAETSAESRQILEKAQREERQRQVEAIERRMEEAGKAR